VPRATAGCDGGTTAAAPAPTQLLGSEDVASGAYDGVVVVVVPVVVDVLVVVVVVVVVPAANAEAAPSATRARPRTRNQTPRRIAAVCRTVRLFVDFLQRRAI
jgi:hypothetical protein